MTLFFDRRVTPEMARRAAQRLIDAAFHKTDQPRPQFRIPTQPSDDDVVVVDYITQSAADLTEALRLLREMRALFTTIRDQTTRKADPHAVPITLHDLSSGLVTQLDVFLARFSEPS